MAQDVEVTGGNSLISTQAVPYTWLDRLREFSPASLATIGLVLLSFAAFLAFLGSRALEPRYTLLFSGLEVADAQQIVSRLEALDVPFRLSDDGGAVMVPADQALRLRMTLAEEGVAAGGVVGYEIFDETDSFGTTDFLSNVNLKRALEGELSRTIASMQAVRSARVHVVQPERVLFRRETTAPSASVFLSLRRNGGLPPRSIAAIRHLVASAVPGLAPAGVTILDDSGQLLARSGGEADPSYMLGEAESFRAAFEERLRQKIVSSLERSVGIGRVDAVVTAELDFDEVSTTQEIFDPEGQVARSTQTIEEESDLNEREPQNDVSVAGNLPTENQGNDASTSAENTARTEETVNYEISRTVRSQTRRGGGIKRLSIAVQVDGRYQPDADGNLQFVTRTDDELDQLETLVRTAAGLDDERGDTVSIVSREFVLPEAEPLPEPPFLGLEKGDYLRFGELLMIALLAIAVATFGLRPLWNRIQVAAPVEVDGKHMALIRGEDGRPMLVRAQSGQVVTFDEAGKPVALLEEKLLQLEAQAAEAAEAAAAAAAEAAEEVTIDLNQIDGKVRLSLVNEVAKYIDNRPDDAVRVIRGWLAMD